MYSRTLNVGLLANLCIRQHEFWYIANFPGTHQAHGMICLQWFMGYIRWRLVRSGDARGHKIFCTHELN
jgi:hypothetical protein